MAPKTDTPLVEVSCVVDASDDDAFERVARAAERAGLQIDQRLPAIGVVTGNIAADRVARLRRVSGVEGVELVGAVRAFVDTDS